MMKGREMTTNAALLCLALCAGTFTTAHATQTAEGVLEKGAPYSALFGASPESGDLIGYAFKNESAAGKAILKHCLPGLFCKVEKSTMRAMDNAPPLKTANEPMGWIEVTAAKNPRMEPVVFGYDKTMKTRYGVLSVREEGNALLFKGKPVIPAIEGNSSLSIVASYELGKNDVFLLQDTGGRMCPALFQFVTINAAGLRATPVFGTCSDNIYPTSDSEKSVTVAMVGIVGNTSFYDANEKTPLKTVFYKYLNGQIFENGKPIQ